MTKMIRTYILPCKLQQEIADFLNMASGRIYSHIVSRHWKLVNRKNLWLSEKNMLKLSDLRVLHSERFPLHAHTIDAAQEGFFKACKVTRALRKVGFSEARFPYHPKKFRTTVWKSTAIKKDGDVLSLSNGKGNSSVFITLPQYLQDCLRVLEVRLVFDKRKRKYTWHVVAENGKTPSVALGDNIVSVDLGEIHPAVVGDEEESTIITCRERRHQQQGHAKRLAKIQRAIDKKKKNSRRCKRLLRSKNRMIAKYNRVTRDIEHKISRAIVDVAVERKASLIVIGDVRDIADEVNLDKENNQKVSSWNHGKIQKFTEYKAEAEGISVELQKEYFTSQTCPNCGKQHKPKGRIYSCPSCGFSCHRDVVGQVNILSAYKFGEPGKLPAPQIIKHRTPYNVRRMRRCWDTSQVIVIPVARRLFELRETA